MLGFPLTNGILLPQLPVLRQEVTVQLLEAPSLCHFCFFFSCASPWRNISLQPVESSVRVPAKVRCTRCTLQKAPATPRDCPSRWQDGSDRPCRSGPAYICWACLPYCQTTTIGGKRLFCSLSHSNEHTLASLSCLFLLY